MSPVEYPSDVFSLRGTWIHVEQIVCEQLRAMGADVKFNRAPRGNLARQLGGGKGKKKGGLGVSFVGRPPALGPKAGLSACSARACA